MGKKRRAKEPGSQPLEISAEEVDELLKKIEEKKLDDKDFEKIKAFIHSFVFIQKSLEGKNLSIKKLRSLFFSKTEKLENILPQTDSAQGNQEASEIEKKKVKKKGHGKNGASAYVGAKEVYVSHEKLKAGQLCPDCEKGKIYKWSKEGIEIRVKGNAPLKAYVYKLEKLRCALCGELYTAQLPAQAGKAKYDEEAGSMIAMLKYGCGFPYYRLDSFQKALGVPVPASTQWEIIVSVFKTAIHVYEEMLRQAAQGELMHTDDTGVKILSVIKENKMAKPADAKDGAKEAVDTKDAKDVEVLGPWEKRKATYTTGVMSHVSGHVIVLYFSSKKYAGENLDDILKKRTLHLGLPLQMSDALTHNYPREFSTIIINCLAHGRRRFAELVESYPTECRFVIETLATVYQYDAEAREQEMASDERLCFHQEKSKPAMDKLEKWLKFQFDQKKVEPNSNLGQAIKYMQKHWQQLTGFLRIEGAPLDNNCLERALKVAILNRKNSYFYKTKNGAHVGDVFMSIIETCRQAKANPLEFLTVIQKNSIDVLNNPGLWLPWNYKENSASIDSS